MFISQRDHFAILIINGLLDIYFLSRSDEVLSEEEKSYYAENIAEEAYKYADAMLKVRKNKK